MSTQDTKEEEEENDKNNEAYFIILIPSEEKINFQGLTYKAKNMIEPSIISKNRVDKNDYISRGDSFQVQEKKEKI